VHIVTVGWNANDAPIEAAMRDLLGDGPVASVAVYHLESGGSRTRATLALDTAAVLGLDIATGQACACAAELLHNASLVHDDLQDRDPVRRGHPSVWHAFDEAAALCAGDLMISAAYASLAGHPAPARAITLLHQAVAETARGQAADLAANVTSVAEYRALVAEKTGPLMALPVRLALCAARLPGGDVVKRLGRKLSIAYQMLDDLHDRDADRAAGRVNICTILEAGGLTPAQARDAARHAAKDALTEARELARTLPHGAGSAYRTLVDRLDGALTEHSHAA
jgi:geranylgeranyl diphosphate synthase type II